MRNKNLGRIANYKKDFNVNFLLIKEFMSFEDYKVRSMK